MNVVRNINLIASTTIAILGVFGANHIHHVAAFNGNTNHATSYQQRSSQRDTIIADALSATATATDTDTGSSLDNDTTTKNNPLISPEDIHKISRGGVAIVPNWLPPHLLESMRADVHQLFNDGQFRPDGLTNTALGAANAQGFTSKADRQTFRGGAGWDDDNLGDGAARAEFAGRMRDLRGELARGLDRPTLEAEGKLKHEMTYNWYEPLAKLGRHLDEHHEETKGPKGWQMPTRRSVTWLVYLNDDWKQEEGGVLRCFPRSEEHIGSSNVQVGVHEGNLQVGWVNEGRDPVFLDCFRESGGSALYKLASSKSTAKVERRILSANDFDVPGQPIEFASFLKPELKETFTQISTSRKDPRFASASGTDAATDTTNFNDFNDNTILDITPAAGTLVLFDSVSLPHLVREVTGKRQRIAATGWFHEDSQFVIEV